MGLPYAIVHWEKKPHLGEEGKSGWGNITALIIETPISRPKFLLDVRALANRVEVEHASDLNSFTPLLVQESWISKMPHLLRSTFYDIKIPALPHALWINGLLLSDIIHWHISLGSKKEEKKLQVGFAAGWHIVFLLKGFTVPTLPGFPKSMQSRVSACIRRW